MSRLSLSLSEMHLPPWEQMLHNGALHHDRITISDPEGSSMKEDDTELDGYFSDEENDMKYAANNVPALDLREYQKELAENALQGDNTIICAPTGSGKTRVATYIILEHLKNSDDVNKRKVAFLAKTVPLAVQQHKAMRRYLPSYEITIITGQSGEPMSLHMLIRCSDIIVMTPQILENHLARKLLPNLGVFSLLVFDECHHTRKKDPYKVLMTSYLKSKDKLLRAKEKGENLKYNLPQIVGLTATIGVGKANIDKDAVKSILEVCASLDVANMSAVRRNKTELAKVVPVPDEVLVRLTERDNDESVTKIHKTMDQLENQLIHHVKELNNSGFPQDILKDMPTDRKIQVYEQWAVNAKTKAKEVAIRDPERETNIPVRLSIIILEYLIAYHAALETYDLVELRDVIEYLERCLYEFKHQQGTTGENRLFNYFKELKNIVLTRYSEENPNLRILIKTLMQYLIKKGDKSCGIIFVRTRALAEALSKWLNRCEIEAIKKLNACSFTGSNVPEEKGGTSQAHQEAILQRFKSGDVRLIVATSVAEEGLDIKECNLVIKYNHVGTEVTTVQTRGRCRQFGGVSILLAMGKILQKERINRYRVELMRQAIEIILEMDPAKFKTDIEDVQKVLLQKAYIEDRLRRLKISQFQYVPFRMVCAWCRKVSVDGSNVKLVEKCHRVSIDRHLLDHIEVIPDKEPQQINECLLVGKILCKGEPEPGSKCKKKLGRVMKYQQIPFVVLDIKCFAFDFGSQGGLTVYNKWKDTDFAIDDLSFEDINRYLDDNRVLPNAAPEANEPEIDEVSYSDSESDDDN